MIRHCQKDMISSALLNRCQMSVDCVCEMFDGAIVCKNMIRHHLYMFVLRLANALQLLICRWQQIHQAQ